MAQKMSIKKKASAAVAGVLAVALAVGGAYAWVDYSQSARNTFRGLVAEGVLLHDDFDGQNKDVYVENTGDGTVYVRVKFAEYLQIGNTSILPAYGEDADAEGYKKADPKDVTTWPVHQFLSVNDTGEDITCNGNAADSHTYFEWNMTGAQKYYLAGVTEADPYGRGGMTQEDFDALTPGVDFTLGSITTHKNRTLDAAPVMMLSDYLALNVTQRSNTRCWLLDTDGWAYWSKPLASDTATNLLLDEVLVKDNSAPYDNAIYHIDVQLQAASINEMDNWYANGYGDEYAVANPDNSIATATTNGYNFIQLVAGNYISSADGLFITEDGTKYIAIAPNYYRLAEMSGSGFVGVEGTEVIAGYDQKIGTDDDNMLAGRNAEWGGGTIKIDTTSIDPVNRTYLIEGASEDYVVTAGIDKLMGTWDDVITSKTGALGQYDIDGGAEGGDDEVEYIGWNYLGGSLDNMLVATEYVINHSKIRNTATEGNDYLDSALYNKIKEIEAAMNITGPVKEVTLDMSETKAGTYALVCVDTSHITDSDHSSKCTGVSAEYYTTNDGQEDIPGTKLFALSLNEVAAAYGDGSAVGGGKARLVPAAPKWLVRGNSDGFNSYNLTSLKDGDGNPVATANWSLRSPGFASMFGSRISGFGAFNAAIVINADDMGVRPACYLDLSGATTGTTTSTTASTIITTSSTTTITTTATQA